MGERIELIFTMGDKQPRIRWSRFPKMRDCPSYFRGAKYDVGYLPLLVKQDAQLGYRRETALQGAL